MSLLDGPLNVFGQRTTGDSVRTQNGEFCCGISCFYFALRVVSACRSWRTESMIFFAAGSTRAYNANASNAVVKRKSCCH